MLGRELRVGVRSSVAGQLSWVYRFRYERRGRVVTRTRVRGVLIAMTAGFIVGITGTSALAVTVYSSWESVGTIAGYYHQQRSFASNTSGLAGGNTVSSSPAAPAGWMGSTAYLYRGTSICASAGERYNTAAVNYFTRSASGYCGAGSYSGLGFGRFYTGSQYILNESYMSPYVNG